jgi:hypothetical protein
MATRAQIKTVWGKHFDSIGCPAELRDSYLVYVDRMARASIPAIFDFAHLAALLGRTTAFLASAVNGTASHYRQFQIPKRRGGKRTISAPYPALLECQQWINMHILARVPIHRNAHGFRRSRSIATNAMQHLNQECLLKTDLKDFFPSISLRRVIAIFRRIGYPRNISVYLARLCCLNGTLPQGAATSPTLSNIAAHRLDSRLSGLAKSWELRYTRYADDLTFSGNHISLRFLELVNRTVDEEGFQVNAEKTRLCRGDGRRVVTGLSVSGDQLRIPREYKRKLRQEVHYISVYGYLSHAGKRKMYSPLQLDSLYGKLLFWTWVEPDNSFAQSALEIVREEKARL